MKEKKLYIDPSSGILGDDFLALLLDLGADCERLSENLSSLTGRSLKIGVEKHLRGGILCSKLKLDGDFKNINPPNFTGLKKIISESSALTPGVKEKCLAIFAAIAGAVGETTGADPEEVPPEQMWDWKDIINVAGSAFCLEELEIGEIISASVRWGKADTADPEKIRNYAVSISILRGVPLNVNGTEVSIITPTAAAMLKAFVSSFAGNFYGIPERAGYCMGNKALSPFFGFIFTDVQWRETEVICLTANIDDMTGEELGYLSSSLMKEPGVLDVSYVPAYGKKNRPLYILNVIGKREAEDGIIKFIFKNSSTAGLRIEKIRRAVMEREFVETEVLGGKVKVKRLFYKGIEKFYPEWEDCRALSEKSGRNAGEIYALAKAKAVL